MGSLLEAALLEITSVLCYHRIGLQSWGWNLSVALKCEERVFVARTEYILGSGAGNKLYSTDVATDGLG